MDMSDWVQVDIDDDTKGASRRDDVGPTSGQHCMRFLPEFDHNHPAGTENELFGSCLGRNVPLVAMIIDGSVQPSLLSRSLSTSGQVARSCYVLTGRQFNNGQTRKRR